MTRPHSMVFHSHVEADPGVLLSVILVYVPTYPQVITRMKLVTLHVPETYLDGLEKLVENNLYPNRSEAIRIAIRDLLKRELWG